MKLPPPHSKRRAALVLSVAFLWLACLAGARPLMLPDEGRYVGVAWEMLASGHWSTPTLDGLPFFHKPPLFYWITAASLSVFGHHEWAARLAPLLGGLVALVALHLFARRWCDDRVAELSTMVLALFPMFYLGAQFANHDMLVAGFLTATVLLLAHAALLVDSGEAPRFSLVGAGLTAALGVLSKGLIGIVLPVLVVGAWLVLAGRWRALLRLASPLGFAVFLLVVAPWFIAAQWHHPDFLNYFFVVQHFKRYAAGGFNNQQPVWFYPAVLAAFTIPWLPWLRGAFSAGYFRDGRRGLLRLLMAVWGGVVVAFFSVPASKLVGYVLPVLPPLAFLVADALAVSMARTGARTIGMKASAITSAAVIVAALAFLSSFHDRSNRELGLALGEARRPAEPVFMLDDYFYDVPFYARLEAPARVVSNWQGAEVRTRDNWRKELAEAGDFSTPRSRELLLQASQLNDAFCGAARNWILGPTNSTAEFPVLKRAEVVRQVRDMTLWRLDRARVPELSCPASRGLAWPDV